MKKGIIGVLTVLFFQSAMGMEELKEPKLYQQVGSEWVQIGAPQKLQADRNNFVERLTAGEMITIGKLVWEIIKEGEPVLDFQSERLGVLPKGIKTASELTNWQKPITTKYKVVYENMLGFEMVSFEYRLIFTPGGKYKGKGHYLTNIAIEPSNIEVSWGYNLNAHFEALDIVNLGNGDDPMAGMELQLTWSVDTLIHKSLHQTNFFISGDGNWEKL